MRKYVLCMLFLLLLAACQSTPRQAESPAPEPTPTSAATVPPTPEPTSEPTAVGIELDVGDGEHKFWIEITEREEEVGGIWVNIYRDKEDSEPYQRFEDRAFDFHRAGPHSVDADFDGNMDFYFEHDWGSLPVFWFNHYIWDATEERFVQDPYGLNDIPNVQFDSEREVVTSWENRATVCYQYEDGQLVRVSERFCPEEDDIVKAYSGHRVKVDEDHVFWVELVDTDTYGNLMVNIYEKPTDREPVQNFEDQCECSFGRIYFYVEDVNFDGDTDFGVLYSKAPNGHASFSYYIWDAKEEKFIPDPYGLNELCSVGEPEMLPEEKAIRTFMRSNAGRSGEARFYRYLPEGFTCVRKMDWEWHEDTDYTDFLVESYENGEMRIVYQDSLTPEALDGYLWSDEFSNWWDLSYPGE